MIFREYKTYGEGAANMGDLFVEEGARRILSACNLNPEDKDTLLVIGTPWLWNLCWDSPKYLHLREAMEGRTFKRKIALGIGSCFGWNGRIDLSLNARRVVELWRGFDLVICRDEIAKSLIPDSLCLPCPSLWFMDSWAGSPHKELLQIGCDPWHSEYICDPSWLSQGHDYWNYRVAMFRHRGDLETAFAFIASHRHVISKRIHAILPVSPFVRTRCVPSDSRAMTCRNAMIPIHPQGEWSNPEKIMEKRNGEWLSQYQSALQAFK